MDIRDSLGLETPFDHLTALLCDQFQVPFGLVSFVHRDLAVFRSEVGFGESALPRNVSVSNILVGMGPGAHLTVEDAQTHPVLKNHPMVAGKPFLRFFAGVTVCNGEGEPVGAIGVMDAMPRPALSPLELKSLHHFASVAGSMLDQVSAQKIQTERMTLLTLAEQMAGVGHWRFDVLSGKVTWSDEVFRIHGLEPGKLDPSYPTVLTYYHPDDAIVLSDLVTRAIENGEGYEFRLRLQPPGLQERLVDAKATTELDEFGRTVAVFGVFQDVTEKNASETRLRESEERFRLMATNASDILATYGPDGVFTYLSPSVFAALGYHPEELVGRSVNDLIHPDDVADTWAAFGTHMASPVGSPAPRISYRALGKDGALRWLEAHPTVIRDASGRPTVIQDLVRDVSSAKDLQLTLTNAREEAERATQAKSDFLANMSHEIRTPLTAILGFSSLLNNRDDMPGDAEVHVNRIAKAGQTLLSIVNDVLDFSKLEAGQYELRPEVCDPLDVCHEALLMFAPMAQEKGVALDFEQIGDLPENVEVDPHRLRQILLNLVGNAIKFTDAGSVGMSVSYDVSQNALAVSIRDTGAGMSSEQCERLFIRFSQVDASSTRRHGGTGLGLAICKGLSEAMGGTISVTSRIGVGSAFSFSVSAPVVAASVSGQMDEPSEDHVDLDGLRLLVVDDNAGNRELVSALAGGLGIEVFEAEGGAEAIVMAGQLPFDVILMDRRMPGMNGNEAARKIKDQPGPNQSIPILVFSANSQVEATDLADFDGVVSKPINLPELLSAIGSSLSHPATAQVSSSLAGAD